MRAEWGSRRCLLDKNNQVTVNADGRWVVCRPSKQAQHDLLDEANTENISPPYIYNFKEETAKAASFTTTGNAFLKNK